MRLPPLVFNGSATLMTQIAQYYREQISSGSIPQGSRLPTCLELSRSLKLAPRTVNRALDLLAQEGLVYRRRSLGTIVGPPSSDFSTKVSPSHRARTLAPPISMVLRRMEKTSDTGDDLFFSDYFSGLMEGFNAWKCRFEIAYLRPDQPDLDLVRTLVETRQTQGFINLNLNQEATDYLVESKTPMVMLNADLTARGVASVMADHVHGYREAWGHANELGHSRAAFCGFDDEVFPVRSRECNAGRELAGSPGRFDPTLQISHEADAATIWNALEKKFGPWQPGREWPTLIFAQTDWIATQLIRALEAHGVRVPRDMSVIGFNDSAIARHFQPSLTTLAKPRFKMALAASQMLLDILARRPGSRDRRQVFPVQLISRETCITPNR